MRLRGVLLSVFAGVILGITFFRSTTAIPTTYDQRQDGKYNVRADLENFLIIVATSSQSNLFSELAAQALELQGLTGRSKSKDTPINQQSSQQQERPESATVVYETEDANSGKEPYRVEIVHIEKEEDNQVQGKSLVGTVRESENPQDAEESEEKLPALSTESVESQSFVSIDSDAGERRERSLWKNVGRKLEDVIEKKTDLTSTEKQENVEVVEHFKELKEEALKGSKSGGSLKKQLSKKEQDNAYLILREKNDISFKEERPEELKLLGDAIENCGPGRYRDNSGICQIDETFSVN